MPFTDIIFNAYHIFQIIILIQITQTIYPHNVSPDHILFFKHF